MGTLPQSEDVFHTTHHPSSGSGPSLSWPRLWGSAPWVSPIQEQVHPIIALVWSRSSAFPIRALIAQYSVLVPNLRLSALHPDQSFIPTPRFPSVRLLIPHTPIACTQYPPLPLSGPEFSEESIPGMCPPLLPPRMSSPALQGRCRYHTHTPNHTGRSPLGRESPGSVKSGFRTRVTCPSWPQRGEGGESEGLGAAAHMALSHPCASSPLRIPCC